MQRIWTSSIGVFTIFVIILAYDVTQNYAQQQTQYPYRRERQKVNPYSSSRQLDNNYYMRTSYQTFLPSTTSIKPMTTAAHIQRGDQNPPTDDIDDLLNERIEKEANLDFDYPEHDLYPLFGHSENDIINTLNTKNDRFYNEHRWRKTWLSSTTTTEMKNYRAYRPQLKVHPCEQSSCYPATGNLLIGREQRLTATSTCGIGNPERYCIVSHLEEKKCFLCDTREGTRNDPLKNHRIGQIIYKTKPGTRDQTWWQSVNWVENVTIQLDLEAEFHFTHLIIVFGTFRPAAMFIERSYDFGKTWRIYRYFAHNCAEAFPNIATESKNLTDVVCDQRYSGVEPSKNGEIIFRVLPPTNKIADPYADHIQNMLKMTNLRINFTKLHTLGDTLLDDRSEIQEKYYYAITSMVVRGSCSCYGHASRCLPLDDVENTYDMVHGRCECTHNTKGLNCEDCEDFYNDLPWKPAFGKKTNACRKCNCNNHATSCHYDEAVFENSGGISGGVCDHCQHNTQGQHCEECILYFYRDPEEDIQSPNVCRPCDCDPRGSHDDGVCDSRTDVDNGVEAGACHCKTNVKGRRCDMCKDGYWNLGDNNPDGCQNCTCNTLGTINNSGCNMYTGECTCKRYVIGKDCNQCMPETYGLSDSRDGCSLCNCDLGGAYDNFCDITTGQCKCRSHMTGRTCNIPKQNHYIPNLHTLLEAENPLYTECISSTNYGNCSVFTKDHPYKAPTEWTGNGFLRVHEGSTLTVKTNKIPKTLSYDVIVRHETQTPGDWENAVITLIRPEDYVPDGECANSHPNYEQNIPFTLAEGETSTVVLHEVCLEQGKSYKFRITFERQRHADDNPTAQILVDSLVLIPRIDVRPLFKGSPPAETRRRTFYELGCNETYYRVDYEEHLPRDCKDLLDTFSILVYDGATLSNCSTSDDACNCDLTGSMSKKCEEFGGSCQCKPNVVGRQCDHCAPGTYGFSPEGCKDCDCNSIGAKDRDCDLITGQCRCNPNTYGRECDQCKLGYWNFPNCQICDCNGHAPTCEGYSGECIDCKDNTTGYHCDRCIDSFYGNPLLGSEIGCRPCRCPDTLESGHTFANECTLDPRTNDMICYCKEGYAGPKCDVCADNYYGDPEQPGGSCKPCNCNENIDMGASGNCDAKTGKCLQCLYNTDGDHCEYCYDGFYGNAFNHNCQLCDCDRLGTNNTIQHCNRYTGQCPCLKNVIGQDCSICIENHWKIASGVGCEPCECDQIGSIREQCNPYVGDCECKQGFGGRECNQCEKNYWGNPNEECHHCECNIYGSAHEQCDRQSGQCVCRPGMGGYKCDICARGYYGKAPHCDRCGECFDNWDLILDSLQNETTRIINEAKKIKTIGATGAYTKEFDEMEKKFDSIQNLLNKAVISPEEIQLISDLQNQLRKNLNNSVEDLQNSDKIFEGLHNTINLANVELEKLKEKSDSVKDQAETLKRNATKLQEANVEGALNLTRAAWGRVTALAEMETEIVATNAEVERQCRRTAGILERTDEFSKALEEAKTSLNDYNNDILLLNSQLPELNVKMCDGNGDTCDSLCGGAGCGKCGGLSCGKGALSKALKSLDFTKDTEANIKKKEETAENLIRSLSQAKANASEIHEDALSTEYETQKLYNTTAVMLDDSNKRIEDLLVVLVNNTAFPKEIRDLADKTIALDLQLDPEEIKKLAKKINDTVASLKGVDQIIKDTEHNLDRVETLKATANDTKNNADNILEKANKVVEALKAASEAGKKANQAIKDANTDVSLAKNDLDHIDRETLEAQKRANETSKDVDYLQKRLNDLTKSMLTNDLDAKEIKEKAELVKMNSQQAFDKAERLRNNYKETNGTLNNRAKTSEEARSRAQLLLQRASKITVETNEKLKELEEILKNYNSNEKLIHGLEERMNFLDSRINGYIKIIQENADRYRQCSS